jgi:dethiobiotin synthetase
MIPRVVVTGTDTGIGKTVFSAALTAALDGVYWKPVQAGLDGETDTQTVQRLAGLPADRLLPEAYRLNTPASPHLAAEIDGVTIDAAKLTLPPTERPLVIEGAGGLLVPLTRELSYLDVIAGWRVPVVLCARTSLGTINHSLLSIEALRARGVPLLGIAFIGDAVPDSERTIADIGRAHRLGRLPLLATLNAMTLRAAFAEHFDIDDFRKPSTA